MTEEAVGDEFGDTSEDEVLADEGLEEDEMGVITPDPDAALMSADAQEEEMNVEEDGKEVL